MRASHDAMSSPLQLCLLLGIPNRVLPRLLSLRQPDFFIGMEHNDRLFHFWNYSEESKEVKSYSVFR